MYGWYSEKQAELSGILIYKNQLGDDVKVTEVTQSDKHRILHDDVNPLGFLGDFVRRESWGDSSSDGIIPFDKASDSLLNADNKKFGRLVRSND